MSNQDIINLGKTIDGFGAAQQGMLGKLAGALRDLQTLKNIVINTFRIGIPTVIWVDMVDGNDANTGLNPARPLKTWKAVCDAMRFGRGFVVRFMDDAIADYTYISYNPPSLFAPEGWSKDGTARTDRVIRFVDSINLANNCGGLLLQAGTTLSMRNISIDLAHNHGGNPFHVLQGRLDVVGQFGTIRRTGTSPNALFNPRTSAHLEFNALAIDPSARGYIVQGVPAGGDPNLANGVTANFNQA